MSVVRVVRVTLVLSPLLGVTTAPELKVCLRSTSTVEPEGGEIGA